MHWKSEFKIATDSKWCYWCLNDIVLIVVYCKEIRKRYNEMNPEVLVN